jgi:hypothetical protein
MKAFPIAAAVALFAAILAPNSSRAGASFQFGYGGGTYGHGHHEYGYPYYPYRRYGYRSFRHRHYGYPTYQYDEPAYSPPPAAAAPARQAPAPSQPAPYCREYTREIVIDGETQTAYGTACMQTDGRWRLVN